MFRDVPPKRLLREVTNISFGHNSQARDGYFYWVRNAAVPDVAYSMHFQQALAPGAEPTLELGYLISADAESEQMGQHLFRLLVDGVTNGRWRIDPNLGHHNPGPDDLVDPRDRSLVCELWVGLDPGKGYSDSEVGLSAYLAAAVIYVGVYYDYDTLRTAEHGGNPQMIGKSLPRVFILGNRTTSHIYMLGEKESVQLHDKALELYLRLAKLKRELSEKK
ncbi:MAG: hypothetical protein IPK87_10575 [Planctomycetes bacterium]|nr:hypothetical protein [Planctomycetota bacterium]